MESIVEFFLPGIALGIAAGLSPGPTMALLVSESLRGGFRSGVMVALVPIVTDIPAVAISILLAREMRDSPTLLGSISIVGGLFLLYLAISNIRSQVSSEQSSKASTLTKAIIVNITNPFFYLFWFSIAVPTFAIGTPLQSGLFAGGIIAFSTLTMCSMSLGIQMMCNHLDSWMHPLLKIAGLLLLLFSLKLLWQGVSLIGML